jgi:hypothetical protein
MRELALHILDHVEDALEVGARNIELVVLEDYDADRLTITVRLSAQPHRPRPIGRHARHADGHPPPSASV